MDITSVSGSPGSGRFQFNRAGGPGRGGAGGDFSPAKARSALNQLSQNFDTIDQDKDGSLSSSEIRSFADESGVEVPQGRIPSGITREKIAQFEERLSQFEQGGARPNAAFGRAQTATSLGQSPSQATGTEAQLIASLLGSSEEGSSGLFSSGAAQLNLASASERYSSQSDYSSRNSLSSDALLA